MNRRRGRRPLRELALDGAILVLGALTLALAVSTLVQAMRPGPAARPRPTEARLGAAADRAPERALGGGREGSRGGEAAIRVEVLNGCGVTGAGLHLTTVLRRTPGIDVLDIGNADRFDFERTVVIDRIGDGVAARAVARALGDPPVIKQRVAASPHEVTVIVGYDGGRWKRSLAGGAP